MDAIGDEALRWFTERPLYETLQLPPETKRWRPWCRRYLNSRAFTIMGGTSEIQDQHSREVAGRIVIYDALNFSCRRA